MLVWECGLHTIGLQALLGSGTWVGILNCASPPGAELEESSKNTKKLDAMTLIKEGGSHAQRAGTWEHGPNFPSPTGGRSLKQQRDCGGKPPSDRSESASCPDPWVLLVVILITCGWCPHTGKPIHFGSGQIGQGKLVASSRTVS